MVRPVAAGPLADRQAVLDDPGEVAGLDALRPLALHAARGHAATSVRASTVARTSCTRTMATPWRAAHTTEASEPSIAVARRHRGDGRPGPARRRHAGQTRPGARPRPRRPAPGRGRPCATARRRPASPVATMASSRAEEGEVVRSRLAEPEARIDPDLVDAGGERRLGPFDEEGPHIGDDVVVRRVLLHRPGVAKHVHRDPGDTPIGGHGPQRRRDVVHDRSAGGDGRVRGAKHCGCRSRSRTCGLSAVTTGQHATQLLGRRPPAQRPGESIRPRRR